MEGIEQKAIELIEKFEALATDIAPDAIELGLMAARVAAVQDIVFSLAISLLAVSLLWFPKKTWKLMADETIDDRVFGTGLASIPAIITGAIGTFGLLNIWAWVGIFYPELWIAKQVLGW